MNILFKVSERLKSGQLMILSHVSVQQEWPRIQLAIEKIERTVMAVDERNNRNMQIPLYLILSVESEERGCKLRLTTGEHYFYKKRLKYAEEDFFGEYFLRVNNQTLINLNEIAQFAPTANARIELIMKDGTTYFVSRHYIKNFRRALL